MTSVLGEDLNLINALSHAATNGSRDLDLDRVVEMACSADHFFRSPEFAISQCVRSRCFHHRIPADPPSGPTDDIITKPFYGFPACCQPPADYRDLWIMIFPPGAFADGDPSQTQTWQSKPAAVGNLLNHRGSHKNPNSADAGKRLLPLKCKHSMHALAGPDVVKLVFPPAGHLACVLGATAVATFFKYTYSSRKPNIRSFILAAAKTLP